MVEQPPASVPDFSALRRCWHPIGFADELAGDPKRVRLLGEDLVAWRDSKGQPHVLRDLCIHRGYDHEQPAQVLQDFEDTIFNQDQRVVESQRPERVPFDLAAEMHLKFDAVAINYRKAMRDQGLAKRPVGSTGRR